MALYDLCAAVLCVLLVAKSVCIFSQRNWVEGFEMGEGGLFLWWEGSADTCSSGC